MTEPGTKEFTFHLLSMLRDLPLEIKCVIFATDHAHADRLFYWKILMEFTPQEYATIIMNATLDECKVRDVSHDPNCNPGILMFYAAFDGKALHSLYFTSQDYGNKHPGKIIRKPDKKKRKLDKTDWLLLTVHFWMVFPLLLLICLALYQILSSFY